MGVASSDGVEIINPVTGALIRTYTPTTAYQPSTSVNSPYLSANAPFSGGSGVSTTAWSPDGKLMASALFSRIESKIEIWKPETGVHLYTFTEHAAEVSSLAWSADSQYVASTSYDQTVKVWNASNGHVIFTHSAREGGALAWAPSGLRLVFAGDAGTFQAWDITANKLVTSYNASANAALAWAPSGKDIAVASNTYVIIWDAATGAHIYTYAETGSYVRSLAWSPDGKYIISGGNNEAGNNYAKVWTA